MLRHEGKGGLKRSPFLLLYTQFMGKKHYMGWDISSTTIGLCLIEVEDGKFKLKEYEFYKPNKKVDLFESLKQTRDFAIGKVKEWKPDVVVIEEIAEHITGSGSTSKTIVKLATYNRTVGLAVYEALQKTPVMFNVNTARSLLRPEGYKGRLIKEDVPKVAAAIMKCDFPWKYKKNGKIADESYDMADAMAVALAQAAKDIIDDTADDPE